MQNNQPFGRVPFDNNPYNVYYQTIPSYTQIIGEGEINSIFIPDGSMQMYFNPTIRYDQRPHYSNIPNIDNFNKNKNTEFWFVRTVTFPIPTSLNNQLHGNHPVSPDYNTNLPCCPKYCQKFHNDNTTSTTDIWYFYPSLRQDKALRNNALVQTNTPVANCNISYDGANERACNCRVSFRIEEKDINGRSNCHESASFMSVDSVQNKSSRQQNFDRKKYKQSKHKNKNHRKKPRDHICECKINDVKDTSDKLVTTYMDRASGNVQRDARDTQTTQKSKRSDIKTEIWVPIKRKSRTKSFSSIDTLNECASCTKSKFCACASTTDSDSQ